MDSQLFSWVVLILGVAVGCLFIGASIGWRLRGFVESNREDDEEPEEVPYNYEGMWRKR